MELGHAHRFLQKPKIETLMGTATKHPTGAETTLLMVPEIFSSLGGISRVMRLYLKAVSDRATELGGRVKLVALNDSNLDTRDQKKYSDTTLADWIVCARDKKRFIKGTLKRSRDCDVVICGHVAQLPVAWAASLLNRRLRYYLVAHGIEVWRPFTLLEKLALRRATKVLCVSDFTRTRLLEHVSINPARAVVMHNALDPYFTFEAGIPLENTAPVILSVSRLSSAESYKGIDHLIAAMPAVLKEEPNARLRIVGRGDSLPKLQRQAKSLGLLDKGVEFLGFVDDQALVREMQACRLFALPSEKEGFGLVYVEAMAYGRPCVAAQAGGVPEVLSDDTGLLVPYGDVQAIEKALISGLRRRWDQSAILARARTFSFEDFKNRLYSELYPDS